MRTATNLADPNCGDIVLRLDPTARACAPPQVASCSTNTTHLPAEPLDRFRTDSKQAFPPGAPFCSPRLTLSFFA